MELKELNLDLVKNKKQKMNITTRIQNSNICHFWNHICQGFRFEPETGPHIACPDVPHYFEEFLYTLKK